MRIFSSDTVQASKARRLGSGIITAAMNKRHEITFSSYDRMFPNQDTMPKGGFGNLIALPLQKFPRKNGNSVFVNEHFIPYSDQWAFLFNIKKLSSKEVDHFVRAFEKSEDENLYSGDPEKPWEPKRTAVLTKNDFPSQVNCVLSNMIYIAKDGISSKGIAQLKRLASFKNPDFYKAQAMRLSTYGKPRIISTFDDTEQYIGLPRGLFDELMQLFINHSVDVNITNKRRVLDRCCLQR